MRSVFVFSTLPRGEVRTRLDEIGVRQQLPPDGLIMERIVGAALWVTVNEESDGFYDDWEPEIVQALSEACGGRPPWALQADVSGRLPGHDEVRRLVLLTCGPGGHAMDYCSAHVWSDSEVATGAAADGHRRFFTPAP